MFHDLVNRAVLRGLLAVIKLSRSVSRFAYFQGWPGAFGKDLVQLIAFTRRIWLTWDTDIQMCLAWAPPLGHGGSCFAVRQGKALALGPHYQGRHPCWPLPMQIVRSIAMILLHGVIKATYRRNTPGAVDIQEMSFQDLSSSRAAGPPPQLFTSSFKRLAVVQQPGENTQERSPGWFVLLCQGLN